MTEFRIVPRTESGLPAQVTSSGGSPRPLLRGVRWFTIHYTGVEKSYTDTDPVAHMHHQQQIWATSKPFQYNYVIGQADDPNVYEFAGHYQGAHSAGENGQAIGCYFLNGVHDRPTDTQVRKAQWLREQLIADGTLRAGPETAPHQGMPGANTSCPGVHIMGVMPQIRNKYQPPEGDDEVTQDQYTALMAQLEVIGEKADALLSHARTQAARANYLNNKWAQQTTRQIVALTDAVATQPAPPPPEPSPEA